MRTRSQHRKSRHLGVHNMQSEQLPKVDASKYVVLDVETNGLSSLRDDLLSISVYKPDTGEILNRFLPLELQSKVLTTHINGIKTADLRGLKPLSQAEVDELIRVFELKDRTILTYGSLDEKFIIKYFKRHRLVGLDFFHFTILNIILYLPDFQKVISQKIIFVIYMELKM